MAKKKKAIAPEPSKGKQSREKLPTKSTPQKAKKTGRKGK